MPDQKHTGSDPRTQGGRARSAAAGRRRTAPVTPQSLVLFAIVLVIYMVIGSLISGRHAKKEQAYLAEYEASRPQYTIEEYIASLDDSFFQNMLLQAAQRIPVSEYETTDGIMDTLQMKSATLDTSQPYSYTKKEDYSDSRPSYYIMRGEDAVASVALDRSGWTDGYNFPIWRVHEPESLLDVHAEPAYSIDVTMAQGCVLKVNGVTVPDDLLKDVESDFVLNNTEQYYMTQPMAKHCVLSGLYMPPTVEVTDEAGNPVTPDSAPDPQAAVQEYHFPYPPDANPDPALVEFADKATRAYMDYVINKNKDRYNNIAVLNNYLMPGSEAAVLMQEIINDIYWNNEYDTREDQVEVQAVRTYSEKLCTVDVHFDTVLTKAEAGTRNEYISTIRWTLVNNGWGWRATSFDLFS